MQNLDYLFGFTLLVALWVAFHLLVKPRVDKYLAGRQEKPSDVDLDGLENYLEEQRIESLKAQERTHAVVQRAKARRVI